jgi:hypothetical protein
MMLDLEIESSEDMEDELRRVDVPRRAYLVEPASRLPFRKYRAALVVWSEDETHVDAHAHEVHDEEAYARDHREREEYGEHKHDEVRDDESELGYGTDGEALEDVEVRLHDHIHIDERQEEEKDDVLMALEETHKRHLLSRYLVLGKDERDVEVRIPSHLVRVFMVRVVLFKPLVRA